LMMLIADNLIDKSGIQARANVPSFKWAEGDMLQGGIASYYRRIKSMTPNGVYGEPQAATLEKGRRITDCVVNSLKGVVTDLYKTKISEKK
jgi:creatinine amidohydrolase